MSPENQGIVFVDGPRWVEQKKFCMEHLRRRRGYGNQLMEILIHDEVEELILSISNRCAVCFFT